MLAFAVLGKKLEERGVAQIFFEIGALLQVFCVDLRDRQAMPAKVPGKLQKGDILFANIVQNPDRAMAGPRDPSDPPPRAAQLAL